MLVSLLSNYFFGRLDLSTMMSMFLFSGGVFFAALALVARISNPNRDGFLPSRSRWRS